MEIVRNYYNGLVENDIKNVDNVSRDVEKVKAFLRSYARNISTECSIETIISDIKGYREYFDYKKVINMKTL